MKRLLRRVFVFKNFKRIRGSSGVGLTIVALINSPPDVSLELVNSEGN